MRKFNSKRSNNLTGIGGEYLSEPGQRKFKQRQIPRRPTNI